MNSSGSRSLTTSLTRKHCSLSSVQLFYSLSFVARVTHCGHNGTTFSEGCNFGSHLRRRERHWRFQSPWAWVHSVLFLVSGCTASSCYPAAVHSLAVVRVYAPLTSCNLRSCSFALWRCLSGINRLMTRIMCLCFMRHRWISGTEQSSFRERPWPSRFFFRRLIPAWKSNFDSPT